MSEPITPEKLRELAADELSHMGREEIAALRAAADEIERLRERQPIETAPRDGTEVLLGYHDWCGDGELIIAGVWSSTPGREFEATWQHAFGTGDADWWASLPTPAKEG